jgi:ankyrin repeat protein
MTKLTKDQLLALEEHAHGRLALGVLAAVQEVIDTNVNGEVRGVPAIVTAVKGRVWESCEKLIDAGADVNATVPDGSTALHAAVLFGGVEFAKGLIERGADVHVADRNGYTALHRAASAGDVEFCEVLINSGARVNECNGIGSTPLHSAASEGHALACALLIEYDADPSRQNQWGETPLHLAARRGHLLACRFLAERGASPSESSLPTKRSTGGSQDRLTPFQDAVRMGKIDVVRYFVEECGQDLAQRTEGGRTMAQVGASQPLMRDFLRSMKAELAIARAAQRGASGAVSDKVLPKPSELCSNRAAGPSPL